MNKCKIQLCLLGYQSFQSEIDKLILFPSKLFEISNCITINQLPSCDWEWGYTDQAIISLLNDHNVNNDKYDMCMCFIDSPIEDNYFSRDLVEFDNKTVLCSFYEVYSIFERNNIDIFNYIHGSILNRVVQIKTLGIINEDYYSHDDMRHCLYDKCGIKSQITKKYGDPKLCPECRSKISTLAVDQELITILEKEFKSFRKPLFYRIIEFIKKKPVLSILITIGSTIILNIIAAVIFELLKKLIF